MSTTNIKLSSGILFFTDQSGHRGQLEFDANSFDVTHDSDGITIALKASGLAALASSKLSVVDGGELTIASGAVTATGSRHTIDTEADAASDDLDTISGTTDGQILVLSAADGARTVVAKDGTGNLKLTADFSMDNAEDRLVLMSNGTNLFEICRSDSGA